MSRFESNQAKRSRSVRVRAVALVWSAAILVLGMAVGARAQFPPPHQEQGPPTAPPGGPGQQQPPPPGPMTGVFSFVEPLSDVNVKVVKDAPFSAVVVRESVQQLADGNRIDRKSTGTFARDSQGRTRREMTLENIGPWAAAGKAAHLVFINDPVAAKIYTLDQNKKTAYEMPPPRRLTYVPNQMNSTPGARSGARHRRGFNRDMRTESLGKKTMEGLVVEGTRIMRTIPAGQIGNENPIVITTERWYSPKLQTTILLKRTDPRFGTSVFQLKNISLAEPPEALFGVPSGYTVKEQRRPPSRGRMERGRGRPHPDFP